MATPAQIAANRANALLSTGPKSAQGKRISSQNSLTHGLSARVLVLPKEDPEQFMVFSGEPHAQLAPQGPIENMIADRIIAASWRLRRTLFMERQIFLQFGIHRRSAEQSEFIGPGYALVQDGHHGCKVFDKFTRYEAHLHRVLRRDLLDLLNIQCLRREAE